jgi:hypothetical protein
MRDVIGQCSAQYCTGTYYSFSGKLKLSFRILGPVTILICYQMSSCT